MNLARITALSLLVSAPAWAGVDYKPTITPPSNNHVYQTGRWYVTVANVGNAHGTSGSVSIQLPETHTSPQVYIMGTLGSRSASCTLNGRRLDCNVGAIRKNNSTQVWFDLALPESAAPLVITATTTAAGDTNTTNDQRSFTANPLNYAPVNPSGRAATNSHCTGTTLTSYFECTLFPGAVTSHPTTFLTGGGIDFGVNNTPGLTGAWYQNDPTHLAFTYYDNGTPIVDFEGWGTSGTCFEGITTFPGSAYVSPYRVCL